MSADLILFVHPRPRCGLSDFSLTPQIAVASFVLRVCSVSKGTLYGIAIPLAVFGVFGTPRVSYRDAVLLRCSARLRLWR